jgi:hypothetical protein
MPRTNHGVDKRTAELRTTFSEKLQRSDYLLIGVLIEFDQPRLY